jgi:RNA polymerase primary sigma factor
VFETRSEEKAERVIAALVADWERQEGVLRRAQVERLILKRHLSVEEGAYVFRRLTQLGIELENPQLLDAFAEGTEKSSGPNRGNHAEEFLPNYFSQRLLSAQEEIELGRTIQLGLLAQADLMAGAVSSELIDFVYQGEHARNLLAESNLRLVLSLAQKHERQTGLDLEDLVQEGIFGLLRAADLFDPDLGLKFSTYATHWIRQSISRGMDNSGNTIRLPVHRVESVRKLRRAKHALSIDLGRQPGFQEIAEALDWTPEKVAYIQHLSSMKIVPIDAPWDKDNDLTWGDIIHSPAPDPEQLYIHSELRRLLWKLLKGLPPRQGFVLSRRFGLNNGRENTLQQIGDELHVTRERIRQIEAKALKRAAPKARSLGIEHFL